MRTFYFVGGPRAGQESALVARLEAAGGSPRGWRIYPHVPTDGGALHIVDSESEAPILEHLAQFGSMYQRGPIVEVIAAPQHEPGGRR